MKIKRKTSGQIARQTVAGFAFFLGVISGAHEAPSLSSVTVSALCLTVFFIMVMLGKASKKPVIIINGVKIRRV